MSEVVPVARRLSLILLPHSAAFRPGRGSFALASSLAAAVAPKCPLCILAYAGSFGAAGLVSPALSSWLAPIAAVWLALTVFTLALPLSAPHLAPAFLAFAGAGTLFAGKFVIDNRAAGWLGLAAMFVAALWRAWPGAVCADESCARNQAPDAKDERP
jgi:hypothetical protein